MVYGAFVGGTLAGVVGIARESRTKNRHKAVVFGMYVAPEFGRRGVARALVRHLVAAAKEAQGLEQLVLTVTHSNEPARLLYESEGFRSFGIEPRKPFGNPLLLLSHKRVIYLLFSRQVW